MKEEYKKFHEILPKVFDILNIVHDQIYFSEDMEHRISFLAYVMEEPFEELWSNLWGPSFPPDDHSMFSDPIFFHEFVNENDVLSYIVHGKSKKEMVMEKNQNTWSEIKNKLNDGMV